MAAPRFSAVIKVAYFLLLPRDNAQRLGLLYANTKVVPIDDFCTKVFIWFFATVPSKCAL